MTKKHFEAIAEIMSLAGVCNDIKPTSEARRFELHGAISKHGEIIYLLSDYFKTQNENFDHIRFITACMKGQSKP